MWSWGLTVLAMFAGGRNWVSGTLAAPVLERLLAQGLKVAIPPAVAGLLRRCFDDDPAARPRSMREIAETLTGVPGPVGHDAAPDRADFYERNLASGARWDDPRHWLQYAFKLAGRDPADAIQFWPTGGRSARSMALGDLAAYAEAARVLEEVGVEDRPEVGKALARVRTMTAMVRRRLGDIEACLDDYREAARIGTAIDDDEARQDSIVALNGLSIALRESGDAAGAVAAAERAVALAAALPDGRFAALARGTALHTRGNAQPDIERRLSDYRAAWRPSPPPTRRTTRYANLASKVSPRRRRR